MVPTWQHLHTPKVEDKREQSSKGMRVPGMERWREAFGDGGDPRPSERALHIVL